MIILKKKRSQHFVNLFIITVLFSKLYGFATTVKILIVTYFVVCCVCTYMCIYLYICQYNRYLSTLSSKLEHRKNVPKN